MAPLRSKINHTLHKINDKIKRHSGRSGHLQEEQGAADAKQPRTLQADGLLVSSPGQGGSAVPQGTGTSSSRTEAQVSQLPRTSSGSSSAMSIAESPATYGFDATSPARSSMSVEFLGQKSTATQASTTSATPLGTLGNPIDLTEKPNPAADASHGELRNTVDLTSAHSPTSVHGQKRYWADPSPLDPSSVEEYAIGQRSKMYRSAANHTTNFRTQGYSGASTRYQTRSGVEQQSFGNDPALSAAWSSGSQPESHLRSTQYRSEDDLLTYREQILATTCPRCLRHLVPSIDKITTRTKGILAAKGVLHPHLSCPKCKTAACVACRHSTAQPDTDLPYRQTGQGFGLAWCCNDGRLFLIWSLCCGPEYKELESASRSPTIGRLFLKGRPKAQKPDPPVQEMAREPAPRALSKGIGYGGDDFANISGAIGLHTGAQFFSSSENLLTPEEKLLPAYFGALGILLSGSVGGQRLLAPDEEPPAMVKFMLHRSPLLPKAAELLRNDSMEDMADRRQTYEPLLGLVSAISRHASLSAVIYDDHTLYPIEEQLVYFSSLPGDSNEASTSPGRQNQRGKGKQPERGSSIAKIVENLARQCRHLNYVASDKEEFKAGESLALLALSRLVCDAAAEHEANGVLATGHSSSTMRHSAGQVQVAAANVVTRSRDAEKAREDLRGLHRDSGVTDAADAELLQNFKFLAQVAGLSRAVPAPGRMKKLVSQIAMLRTSLPEGIWLRHGSSRLDVMKVLMVGPKGTPYENGLFEFDLLCPIEFPTRAPLMYFRTTGGGKVRFNPNLYEDGKVCLSILGTWAGPGWNGAYSTLLQILVSIQAMILVEEPWYNEPGREHTPNKTASKRYNTQIQGYTIEHAMLDWLTNRLAPAHTARLGRLSWGLNSHNNNTSAAPLAPAPPVGSPGATTAAAPVTDDPVWGEIIRKHFAANGKAIAETVKKWKQPAAAKDVINRLNDALTQHGFL